MYSMASVISVSATWLDNSVTDAEILIPNYIVIRIDRNRNGGGVCCYIHNDFAFSPPSDFFNSDDEFTTGYIPNGSNDF